MRREQMMYENIINDVNGSFYTVKKTMIVEAQNELGIIIPADLTTFYEEIGYGFLSSNKGNFNRIMDPVSVCDFRFRKGQFTNDMELEVYTDYERDKLVFFEICEGYYLSIGFTKQNRGEIFDGEKKIADDLKLFLIKYQENENYFK